MPMTLWSVPRTVPPVASPSGSTNETTVNRVLSPPLPPRDPLQNPSINFMNRPPTREIAVIFPSSGQPMPSLFSSTPVVSRFVLPSSTRSFPPSPSQSRSRYRHSSFADAWGTLT